MHYDMLLKNGKIITVDKDMSQHKWIAIKDGKIAALGDDNADGVTADRVVDLEGKSVLPGLMDCHCHVLVAGLTLTGVELGDAKDIAEVLSLLEERCKNAGDEEWVFGVNYIAQNIEEKRYPNRWELDKISHGKKVMVIAATLHGCSTNTEAMKVCAIPEGTPGAGVENGEPNGVFTSDESSFLANANAFGSMSDEKLWQYIKDTANNAAAHGVTTMHGLFGQFVKEDRDTDLILERKDELPIEMIVFWQTWDVDKAIERGLPRVGGCLTLDGGAFEYTQAMSKPFDSAPELRGILYHGDPEVYEVVSKAHANDLQCSMHAIGDRAIDQLAYIYRRVIMEQGPKDLRHRIEHFCLPTDDHIEIAKEYDLICSMQPGFTYLWDKAEGGPFEYIMGRERSDQFDPFHKVIDAGITVCGGSDAPCTPVDPLTDIAFLINGYNPVRNISADEAIKMCTINGAYAAKLEDRKGSLEVGKDADLVVVSRDPYSFKVDPNDFNYDMEALMTVREGKVTYEK